MQRLRWLRWLLIAHPLLLAAWPVISLWQDNLGEVPPAEALRLAGLAAGVALGLLLIFGAILRDLAKGALIASVLVVTVMMWGTARDATGNPGWLLATWLVAALLLCILAARLKTVVWEITRVVAAMSVVVLGMVAVPVIAIKAPDIAAARTPAAPTEDLDNLVGQWSGEGEPRDIFYLVFDRYGAQPSMERRFDFDLSGFFDGLKQRGFYVAKNAKANHLRTAQSLSSTFNLRYHFDLTRRYGPDTGNMLPIYRLLEDHAVGRLLQDRGYEYVHIGAWWDPTQKSRIADVNYSYEQESDFELEVFRSTLLSLFEHRATGRTLTEQRRHVPYDGALAQFENLRVAAARPGPTFTFAHILLPHEPFVFDAAGNYISLDEEGARGRDLNYREQTLYTNQLIDALLDDLLAVPEAERPIIVLAADEGPHPVRFKLDEENFDWTQATDEELEEKFAVLNAYYLPDGDEAALYDSISPINTWRVLFNTYFGADLPLLEDRSYVFRDENHVYDFTEITGRLPTYVGGPDP